MKRRRGHCRLRAAEESLFPSLAFAILLAAAPVAAARGADGPTLLTDASPTSPGDEVLYLQVILNGTDTGKIARFVRDDAGLHASADTLRQLGFRIDGMAGSISLDSLPGLVVHYDAAMQQLRLDAPLSLLSLDTTLLNSPTDAGVLPATASPGALLNYDLYASQQGSARNLTGATELRLFGLGNGIFSNTAVTRAYRDPGEDWRGETVRLDSSWRLSFPKRAIDITLGDTDSGYLGWTRPVRLGGVRIGRDFGLQPYRITTPLPAFLGEVAVPSAVDLYVNGIKQYSGNVTAGPFQLSTAPGINGAGNAQIVVTDAFGRTRTLDFAFYATQQLLAKGLSDWSVAAGVVREDYGIRSFSYADEPVASATLRHGVSDRFTAETHAEGGGGLVNVGAGGAWILGRAGVASLSHARSALDGARGSQTAAAYNWSNGRFNVSLASQRTHGDYRDVASIYGPLPATVSDRALVGMASPRLGNISLSYVRLEYPGMDGSRYAGAFWSQDFLQLWSANLSLNQNLDDHRDRSIFLSLSLALDDRRQLNVSMQRNGDRDNGTVDISRPVPGEGDHGGFGWRLQARDGDDGAGGLAEIGWINDIGRYGAGVARTTGGNHAYASASGSLVTMAGHIFPARNISDSFALVSTDGVAGVPVKLENRVIGRTDAHGMLLVTPLNAWQRNKLSIDPMELPADLRIADVELLATPRDRSGTRVRFAITPVRAAIVVLHDADGRPLPLGSRVDIEDKQATEAIVGYDGETYLDALDLHNRLRVRTPTGVCHVEFNYPAGGDAVPRIGPLTCSTGDAR